MKQLRRHGVVLLLATLPLWSPPSASGASLLLRGDTVRTTLTAGILYTPDGGTLSLPELQRDINGESLRDDDVLEIDLDTDQHRLHPQTLPFEVLISAFFSNDLERRVAVHTEAARRFLVGYGRNTINALGSIVYVGQLDYNALKEVDLLESLDIDFDDDGIPDSYERTYHLDPLDPADAQLDSDGDGLNNLEESAAGTDPHEIDSDHDGMIDSIDPAPATHSNACTGADATFAQPVDSGDSLTCAASHSILVAVGSDIAGNGSLLLLSPRVGFDSSFRVQNSGRLRVDSIDPSVIPAP